MRSASVVGGRGYCLRTGGPQNVLFTDRWPKLLLSTDRWEKRLVSTGREGKMYCVLTKLLNFYYQLMSRPPAPPPPDNNYSIKESSL